MLPAFRDENDIIHLIESQPAMLSVLDAVRAVGLPDCWVAAGFIRNAVWDALHRQPLRTGNSDVDVIFFDSARLDAGHDQRIEAMLTTALPGVPWSVRNQARMHVRNGDAPYADSLDAMRHWPERCTAIGARRSGGRIELAAPLGIADLINLVVRPTSAFAGKLDIYRRRQREKDWWRRWPNLQILN